jgi:hypothetical protein
MEVKAMNKFSCWLVGINDQEYKTFVAKDKKDFKNFSTIIPIVLIIEFFGILNATHYILNKNYLISFFAALTWTYIVLLIERSIIHAPLIGKTGNKLNIKSKFFYLLRIIIGLCLSIIGAFSHDTVLFDKEIQAQLKQNETYKIEQEYKKYIDEQKFITSKLQENWNNKITEVNAEGNGTGGSKSKSIGPLYKKLEAQADQLRKDMERSEQKMDELIQEKKTKLTDKTNSVTLESGFIERVKALHHYITSDGYGFFVFCVISCLLIIVQSLVVVFKLMSGNSVRDHLINNQTEGIISQSNKYTEIITSGANDAYEKVLANKASRISPIM